MAENSHLAEKQDGLVEFVLQKTWLYDRQRSAINLDEAMSTFAVSDSRGRFLHSQHNQKMKHKINTEAQKKKPTPRVRRQHGRHHTLRPNT